MANVPPGYAQVNFRMSLAGDPEEMMTTIGVKFDEIITTTYEEIANDLAEAFFINWDAFLSSTYTFMGVTLYANVEGQNQVFESTRIPEAFGGSPDALTQNTAYLVKKRSAVGGRPGRGRMFVPGVPSLQVDNAGALIPTALLGLSTQMPIFLTTLVGQEGIDSAVILHGPGDFDAPAEITSLTIDSRVATQRRRLR